MSKEKQIEEMATIISNYIDGAITEADVDILAMQMYEKGYRKQSEWISVDERLPEHLDKVLVFDEMGGMYTAIFLRYDNGKTDWCSAVRIGRQVTHWMPLPEAPKMKGGAE